MSQALASFPSHTRQLADLWLVRAYDARSYLSAIYAIQRPHASRGIALAIRCSRGLEIGRLVGDQLIQQCPRSRSNQRSHPEQP